MARSIGMANNETFRAVTIHKGGQTGTELRRVEGPYSKSGPARARVSYWKNRYTRFGSHWIWVDGWIERAETNWERVPD